MNWLKQLFIRRRRQYEISETIHEDLDEKIADLMDSGMTREKAERSARREFGNVTRIEERSREVWQWPRLESVLTDLKLALRRIAKSPGFAATVLLTLAIGIDANTAAFSVVNNVLIKPLPYPEPAQLVALNLNAPGAPGLADFRDGVREFVSTHVSPWLRSEHADCRLTNSGCESGSSRLSSFVVQSFWVFESAHRKISVFEILFRVTVCPDLRIALHNRTLTIPAVPGLGALGPMTHRTNGLIFT